LIRRPFRFQSDLKETKISFCRLLLWTNILENVWRFFCLSLNLAIECCGSNFSFSWMRIRRFGWSGLGFT
jgi:hypothetical protein